MYTNVTRSTVTVYLLDYAQSSRNLRDNGYFQGDYGYYLSFRVTMNNSSYTLNIGKKKMDKLGLDPSFFEFNHNYEVRGQVVPLYQKINYITEIRRLDNTPHQPFTDDTVFTLAQTVFKLGEQKYAFSDEVNILVSVSSTVLANAYANDFHLEVGTFLLPAGSTFKIKEALCQNRKVTFGRIEFLSVPQDIKLGSLHLTFTDLELAFKRRNYVLTENGEKYYISHADIQTFTGYSIKGIKAINERKSMLDKISGIDEPDYSIDVFGVIEAINIRYDLSRSYGINYRSPTKYITRLAITGVNLVNFDKWEGKQQFKFRRGAAAFFRWMTQQRKMLSQEQFNEAIDVFDIAERMRRQMERAADTKDLLSSLMGENYTFFGETIVHQKTFEDGWTLMSFFFYNGASAVYMSLVKNPAILVEEWDNQNRRSWERNKMMYRVVLKKIVHHSKDQYTKEIIETFNSVKDNYSDIRLLKELYSKIPEGDDLLKPEDSEILPILLSRGNYFKQYAAVVGRQNEHIMRQLLYDSNKDVRKVAFDNEMAPDGLNTWNILFDVATKEKTNMSSTLFMQLCENIHRMPDKYKKILLKNSKFGLYALGIAKTKKVLSLSLILDLKEYFTSNIFKAQLVFNYILSYPKRFPYKEFDDDTIADIYDIFNVAYGKRDYYSFPPAINDFICEAEYRRNDVVFSTLSLKDKIVFIGKLPDGMKQAFISNINANNISASEKRELIDYINFDLFEKTPDFNFAPFLPIIDELKSDIEPDLIQAIESAPEIVNIIRIKLLDEKFRDKIADEGQAHCVGCNDPIEVYEGYPFACVECGQPYCERDYKEMLLNQYDFHCFGSIISGKNHRIKVPREN